MRRLLLLLGVVTCLAGAGSAGAATTTVSITKTGFSPRIATVSVGDTVTWTNKDTASHQVVADSGAFASPVLKAGQSWSYTFTKADGYPYRDKLNEALRGSVNVNAKGQVTIAQTGFQPSAITVAAGETVTWTNRDTSGASHQIVADDGSFTSPILKPGGTYSHTFEDGGTFKYHDGLRPAFTGSVVVGAAPPVSLVLAASRDSVIAGGAVTLSGSVSGASAGQTVSIVAVPANGPERTLSVTPDANGSFSLRVTPMVGTSYQAVVKSAQSGTTRAQSSTVSVTVKPRVTLRKVGKIRFSTVVVDVNDVAGNRVYLTRWVPSKQRYVAFTSAPLRATTNDTVFTAVFATKVRHTKLRAYLPAFQAGPGYLAGLSNFIVR